MFMMTCLAKCFKISHLKKFPRLAMDKGKNKITKKKTMVMGYLKDAFCFLGYFIKHKPRICEEWVCTLYYPCVIL